MSIENPQPHQEGTIKKIDPDQVLSKENLGEWHFDSYGTHILSVGQGKGDSVDEKKGQVTYVLRHPDSNIGRHEFPSKEEAAKWFLDYQDKERGKVPKETLGWREKVALMVLNNADERLDREKKLGEVKSLPGKVTEIPDSLFRNEKNELVPFRKQEVVFIPSKDERGRRARIFCIGDVHSDSTGVIRVIEEFDKALKRGDNVYLIALGDYIDRPKEYAKKFEDSEQLDCFHRIIRQKLTYPDRVIALAGNHEESDINKVNGFGKEMSEISSYETWEKYNQTFTKLPRVALLVNQDPQKCHIFVHGGIPYYKTVNNLNELVDNSDNKGFTWADPMNSAIGFDEFGFHPNLNRLPEHLRGNELHEYKKKGYCWFNKIALDNFLEGIGLQGKLIRGHEVPDKGIKTDLVGKVTTIFSANRYKDHPIEGKYLDYQAADNSFNFRNLHEESPAIKQPEKAEAVKVIEKPLSSADKKVVEAYNDLFERGRFDKATEKFPSLRRVEVPELAVLEPSFFKYDSVNLRDSQAGSIGYITVEDGQYIVPMKETARTYSPNLVKLFYDIIKDPDGSVEQMERPAKVNFDETTGKCNIISKGVIRLVSLSELEQKKNIELINNCLEIIDYYLTEKKDEFKTEQLAALQRFQKKLERKKQEIESGQSKDTKITFDTNAEQTLFQRIISG